MQKKYLDDANWNKAEKSQHNGLYLCIYLRKTNTIKRQGEYICGKKIGMSPISSSYNNFTTDT